MWDTSGTEMEYKILPQNVYKIASCYVIVCSYDIRNSFEMIHSWLKHVQLYLNKSGNANPTLPIIILINKLDIKKDKRTFKIRDIIKIIDENNLNIMLYEVSAKENVKLDLVFEKIVGLLTGALSFANEANSLNRTVIEELISNKDLNSTEMINRRRSFQLQGQVRSEVTTDKMAKANKSCC